MTRPDLTGVWRGNANSYYYIREIGDVVWWLGFDDNSKYSLHRPFDHNFVNVFSGVRTNDNFISGSWSDIPRGASYRSGTLKLQNTTFAFFDDALVRNSETGGFGEYVWLPSSNFQARTEELNRKIDELRYKIEEKQNNLIEVDDSNPTYPFDITGWYHCDDKGDYWIRQVGSDVWWNGSRELDNGVVAFSNVFHGTIQDPENENAPYHITGEWVNVPEGQTANSGTLTLVFGKDIGGGTIIEKQHGYGPFGGKLWYPAA